MNAQLGWWPFASWFGLAPNQLNQPILPDWSLQRIEVNFAGDLGIEKEVVGKVASYGKQLGILTDAVLVIAGDRPKNGEDPLRRLREIADEIEQVKQDTKHSLADKARDAMDRLVKADPDAARRVASDYTAKSS